MKNSNDFSWQRLIHQAEGLLSVSSNRISNAANLCALMYREIADVSWVGFYFLEDGALFVGPFQGKPACVRIDLGKGVCGTAAVSGKTIRVADVNSFDGHIVCDADARSEVVVPLFKQRELLGVLDVDSGSLNRFSAKDEAGLEKLAAIYLASIA